MHRTENGWFPALAAAAVLCAAWVGGMPAAEGRVALVVGNSAYQHTKRLENPSNDAEDMAGQLRRLGFEVFEARDLTQADFYDHLRKFSSALRDTKGEAALFFYAGHGMQDENGKNHLVPVDSPMRDEWDLPKMVRVDYVMDAMKGFSGLKLVFLDACRDNPLRGVRSLAGGGKRGLAPMKREPGSDGLEEDSGTLIMYATAPDDTAADGEGRNSPFTEALLEHVGTPGLEVGEMLERVVGTVRERTRRTGKQQVPWMSASKSGRFFFVSGSGGTGSTVGSVAASTPGSTPSSSGAGGDGVRAQQIATEREFWQSIKDSRNPASFRAYLTRYPDGQFAVLAQIRMKELEGAAQDDSPPTGTPDAEDRAQVRLFEFEEKKEELVQYALASLGFDPGPVDGDIGPKTLKALKSWQTAKGYPVTGKLSAAQLTVLSAVGRKAQAQARQDAEAARRAEEARKAQAKAKARQDAEAARRAEEARKAERARRIAAAEAEARRKREQEERRRAEERRIAELTPEMVRIEGGCFRMGSPESETGRNDDERWHRVCVDAFSIGKHEVTFAEYDRFAEATGRSRPDDEGWGRERRPVINVSWHDATAYARWLSGETGRWYRLPTEAEWAYAAWAGSTTAYPWGNSVGNRANCNGCGSRWDGRSWWDGKRTTAPVGSFEANAWGLHDTVGNVWEWTCSEYDKGYGGAEQRCASGSAGRRVFRGGPWIDLLWRVRSANRAGGDSGSRRSFLGFRLAQD